MENARFQEKSLYGFVRMQDTSWIVPFGQNIFSDLFFICRKNQMNLQKNF